jgi:N-acetyl-gamma-glutamyl-phosphate reductase
MSEQISVGIIGASGYTGAELLRLAAQHPNFDICLATGDSMAGRRAADLYPSLVGAYPDLVFESFDAAAAEGLDLVFLGLPHEASMELAPQLVGKVGCIVDLSAAYRLSDTAQYPEFYGFEHTQTGLLAEAVYGLPEFHREHLKGAQLIATPGCHVTAAALALKPLVDAGLIATSGISVNSLTGITGAGRTATEVNMFTSIDSNARAYGLLNHRHTPDRARDRRSSAVHTASRADEPRHPRDLYGAGDQRGISQCRHGGAQRLLCQRAICQRDRTAARDEVSPWLQCCSRFGAIRRSDRHGRRNVCD